MNTAADSHDADEGASALQATHAVVALHATDPSTVFLSVLARCAGLTLADVATELYDERALVRAAENAVPISLGPRILRAETAALAALATFMAAAGDWSP